MMNNKSRFFLKTLLTACIAELAIGSALAHPANENGGEPVIQIAQAGPGFMPQRHSRRAWESDDPAVEALLKAAYECDLEALKAELAKGTPVNVKNFANEHGPLHMALMSATDPKSLEVARALIKAGADINMSDSKGRTPLLSISMNDDRAAMAKLLIDAGADVNARMTDGTPAIEIACMMGRATKLLKLLIAAKADLNAQDHAIGFSPLHYAAKNGHTEQVQALIKAGANVNIGTQPPNRDGKGQAGPCYARGNIICGGTTPLLLAATLGQKEVAKQLIAAKADVNRADENGWTPLLMALDHQDAELVAMFLKAGADPNAAQATPKKKIIASDNMEQFAFESMKMMIGADAYVSPSAANGWTPLLVATLQKKNAKLVEMLLKAGANPNETYKNGTSLLVSAAEKNLTDVVKALIAGKADVNAKITNSELRGVTALHFAAQNGNAEMVKALIAAGADANATVDSSASVYAGEKPLDMAKTEEVKAILQKAQAKKPGK